MRGPKVDLKQIILRHMASASATSVWTPADFLNLGPRQAVDQALHRLTADKVVRRIARGLYDIPQVNIITARPAEPDYVAIVDAIGRRDRRRMTIDEVTEDEQSSVPDTRPSRVVVSTKARLRPLKIGDLTIEFKQSGNGKNRATTRIAKKAPVRLTGGVGHDYEDFVAARFLVDMLAATNGLGPEFGRIGRVDWQARDKGWLTDDLALTCETATAEKREVGISVKSNQQVTTAGIPRDFANTAWSQWLGHRTSRKFRPGLDAIALATAKLPSTVKKAWDALLGEVLETSSDPERIAARLSADTGEGVQSSNLQRTLFESLLPPEGYATDTAQHETIRLLHDIRLLDFDFGSPASHDASVAIRDCQNVLNSGTASDATNLWERLVGIAGEKRGKGGSIDLRELLSKLRDTFSFRNHPDFRADSEVLERFSAEAMRGVQTSIANVARLPRSEDQATIRERLASTGFCLLVGESGSGKSALAKDVGAADYPRVIWLTANALDYDTSAGLDRAIGLRHPFIEVLRASPERCLLIFDGLEAYSERALRLVSLFVQEIISTRATHIHLLLSVQFTAAENRMRQLAALGVSYTALEFTPVGRPTDDNISELLARFPHLRWVANRLELRPVLANLKVLDWLARSAVTQGVAPGSAYIGLTGIIDQLWAQWTEAPGDGYGRSHLLMSLAVAEADALSRGVPRTQVGFVEQGALPSLIQSGLIRVHDDERVSFAHDLLADWARLRVLVAEDPTLSATSRGRVMSPRWQQAVRLFGQRLLERSPEDQERWRRSVEHAGDGASPDALMRDLFLDSLFLAINAYELVDGTWETLTANNGRLLNRMLHRFLFVATIPSPHMALILDDKEDSSGFEHLFRVPFGPYWGSLLAVLHAHAEDVARLAPHNGARICALWLRTTPTTLGQGRVVPWRRQAAELAYAIAREIQALNLENHYHSSDSDRVVYEALMYAAPDLPEMVGELCLELSGRKNLSPSAKARRDLARQRRLEERNRSDASANKKSRAAPIGFPRGGRREPWPDGPSVRIERAFREICLEPWPFTALVQASPDVALEVLLAVCVEEPQYDDFMGRSSLPECGLSYWPQGDPPAYFRGPFLQFLRQAPGQGLSFVLKLTNFGTRRYVEDRSWLNVTIDGQEKRWYGDSNVFRWHHDWPLSHGSQIQSSLMALEQWLYEQIEKGADVRTWIRRVLAESESVAFAGLLLDVGKRSPGLISNALSPLFFTCELWTWDSQLTILRQTDKDLIGYWGHQARQLITLARQWHQLPHRSLYLLGPDGPIAKNMLSRAEWHPFFTEVRNRWSQHLSNESASEHLRLLIERINPDNYTFAWNGDEATVTGFRWPEAIEKKNNEDLRRISEQQYLTQLPWRCRKLLDEETALSEENAQMLLEFLQKAQETPPEIPSESGEPLFRIEDVLCGGIELLLATNRRWIVENADGLAWCRKVLQSTVDNPPPLRRFDSELSVGNWRWDTFASGCGVRLLTSDTRDTLGRQLVAAGLTAFNYHTTAVTMALGCRFRKDLGTTFAQMFSFSAQWAGLRPLQIRPSDQSLEGERAHFVERRRLLVQNFVKGITPTASPSLQKLNVQTKAALDVIHEKRFPGSEPRSEHTGETVGRARSRKSLSPDRLGLDPYVMKFAFGWIDVREADSDDERLLWLNFIRECLGLVLCNIPVVDTSEFQEIDGLPSDFDDWVLQLVARSIPQLRESENSDELCKSLLQRGAPTHQWVERFFWHWFTNGLAASESVADFVRLWHGMITYALECPTWDPKTNGRHDLESIVIELLCFDARWNAIIQDEANAAAVGALAESFAKAFQRWGLMPRVVTGLAHFAIQVGSKHFLLPSLNWISTAAKSFDKYDWKYGLEENVTEFLRVCWQREAQRISNDPTLRDVFLSLLGILVSRGGHAALVLRDRVAGSVAA